RSFKSSRRICDSYAVRPVIIISTTIPISVQKRKPTELFQVSIRGSGFMSPSRLGFFINVSTPLCLKNRQTVFALGLPCEYSSPFHFATRSEFVNGLVAR